MIWPKLKCTEQIGVISVKCTSQIFFARWNGFPRCKLLLTAWLRISSNFQRVFCALQSPFYVLIDTLVTSTVPFAVAPHIYCCKPRSIVARESQTTSSRLLECYHDGSSRVEDTKGIMGVVLAAKIKRTEGIRKIKDRGRRKISWRKVNYSSGTLVERRNWQKPLTHSTVKLIRTSTISYFNSNFLKIEKTGEVRARALIYHVRRKGFDNYTTH